MAWHDLARARDLLHHHHHWINYIYYAPIPHQIEIRKLASFLCMECTSDNDTGHCICPEGLFVSSLPKARHYIVPDDNRVIQAAEQTPQFRSNPTLLLVRETTPQSEQYSRSLLSLAEHDDRHPSVDAHGAESLFVPDRVCSDSISGEVCGLRLLIE